MFKKLSYLTLLWCAIMGYSMLTGCCEEVITMCFRSNLISVVPFDNGDSVAVESLDDFVYGKALMLRLTFATQATFCQQKRSVSFINSAYATSCGKTYVYKNLDKVERITLYADKDYDAQHPAGTPLNDIFFMPKLDVINSRGYYEYNFDMFALQSPMQRGAYVYTIEILLDDGSIVNASSRPVNIIP